MVTNVHQVTSSNVLFGPQPKDIQFMPERSKETIKYLKYLTLSSKQHLTSILTAFPLKKSVKLINRLSKQLANNIIVDNQLDSTLISFHKAM